MEQYDEDLLDNPFYKALQSHYTQLFDEATRQRCSVCVPRRGALPEVYDGTIDFQAHIFRREEIDTSRYLTLNKKELIVESGVITTAAGFLQARAVSILFEETFFNSKDESYRVLCISQPLDGSGEMDEAREDWSPSDKGSMLPLQSMEDVKEMLWANTGNVKTQRNLDNLLATFCIGLNSLEKPSYQQLVESTEATFTKSVQTVLKDPQLKKAIKTNGAFLRNIKTAVETYMLNRCYPALFNIICTCLAKKDGRLNKITRNLSRLQLTDLGVRMDFCLNVPRARREISNLVCHSTPLGKLGCLKRVVGALVGNHANSGSQNNVAIPLTTDDLLPILVFLVVKTDIPNWWAHFAFMTSFSFSKSSNDDEFGFYLASMEAALEHIASGQLCDINFDHETENLKGLQLSLSPTSSSLWQRQDSTSAAVEAFFQYVRDDNQEAVLEIISRTAPSSGKSASSGSPPTRQLCHPLCSCDRCSDILARFHSRSAVLTVHTRDHRGQTALHVAAASGHIQLTDLLIKKGSVVNTSDYLRTTPLHLACQRGHQSIVLLLLHFNACIMTQDSDGNTPLHLATANGHDDCVKAIVYYEQGSPLLNVSASNDLGDTPLHLAAKWGFLVIINLLLENGASATVQNRKGHTAAHYTNNVKLARVLHTAADAERAAHVEARAHDNMLSTSSQLRQNKSPDAVLSQPYPSSRESMPSHSLASSPTDTASFSVSYRKGGKAIIHTPGTARKANSGPTAMEKKVEKLLKTVADGDLPMAKFHLGWLSESESESDDDQETRRVTRRHSPGGALCHPLCQCQKCQPYQRKRVLSSSGLHVNVCNLHGMTPLHTAAFHGRSALVELFLARGADVNSRTTAQDATALHLACKQNQLSVVELLVRHKLRVNTRDSLGNTPLHYACINGNEEQVLILLQSGASVNAVNRKGNTPLHQSIKYNFAGIVKLLIHHGACPLYRNTQNLNALDFIKMHQPHLQGTLDDALAAVQALEVAVDAANLLSNSDLHDDAGVITHCPPEMTHGRQSIESCSQQAVDVSLSPHNHVSGNYTSTPKSQVQSSFPAAPIPVAPSSEDISDAPESDHGSLDLMTSCDLSTASLNNLLPSRLTSTDETSVLEEGATAGSWVSSSRRASFNSSVSCHSDSEDSTTESQKDLALNK